jgi:hypothetical protein
MNEFGYSHFATGSSLGPSDGKVISTESHGASTKSHIAYAIPIYGSPKFLFAQIVMSSILLGGCLPSCMERHHS